MPHQGNPPRIAGPARRRKLVEAVDWTGFDFVEVSESGRQLNLHFFGRVPEGFKPDDFCLSGGRRVRDIRIVDLQLARARHPEQDDHLRLRLDKAGDGTEYTLALTGEAIKRDYVRSAPPARPEASAVSIDPRYASLAVRLSSGPGPEVAGADCAAEPCAPTAVAATPIEISYLAKDYASFRQLMLDRLAVTMPAWRERHVPDIGITLVELLAHAGDELSYQQDAVATEAYLHTARLRKSLRRHARLVDYQVDEGSNARTWAAIEAAHPTTIPGDAAVRFAIAAGEPGSDQDTLAGPIFEPSSPAPKDGWVFDPALNRLRFYSWDREEPCLPAGTTRATLRDDRGTLAALLQKRIADGLVLILQEVIGTETGNPADADPAKRHAIRLVEARPSEDLIGTRADGTTGAVRLVEIAWHADDALPFTLCLSVRTGPDGNPACAWVDDVTVAYGNVLLIDHGASVIEPLATPAESWAVVECACDGAIRERLPAPLPYAPVLSRRPLVHAAASPANGPASTALTGHANTPEPVLIVRETGGASKGAEWLPRPDLLSSGPDDRHLVVEMDETGGAHLRFGDGTLGRAPTPGVGLEARYRIGGGVAGNVGRDTIRRMVTVGDLGSTDGLSVTNPLPALGGRAPESADSIRLMAPHAFRLRRERAILAADYAELAGQHPKVQRAAAELIWTGTHTEVRVYVDPKHTTTADPDLLAEIGRDLAPKRRIGHEVRVLPARYVPLLLELSIEVRSNHVAADVAAAARRALGAGVDTDGRLALFHPDALSFGEPVRLSRIVARCAALEGVASVIVNRLKRLADGGAQTSTHAANPCDERQAPTSGILPLGAFEIAELDGDPAHPERGVLLINTRGGR